MSRTTAAQRRATRDDLPAPGHAEMTAQHDAALEAQHEVLADRLDDVEPAAVDPGGDTEHRGPQMRTLGRQTLPDEWTDMLRRALESIASGMAPGVLRRLPPPSVTKLSRVRKVINNLNIAALAKRTGIAPDTLRKWEQRYGILRPTRTEGGQRRYSEHDVDRVVWLKARLDEGYRIGAAAELLGNEALETGTSPQQLVRLVFEAAARSDVGAVGRLLDHAFALEIDVACAEVVTPLLVEIGAAWHAGRFSIAQEHLVTSAVRARLERKLAEVRAPVHGRAVLACAPGERHELGLMMLAMSLRAGGWDVAYLGPDLPVTDAMTFARESGAALLCYSVGSPEAAGALESGLRSSERAPGIEILIGGLAANAVLAGRIGARYVSGDLAAVVAALRSRATGPSAG